MPNKIGAHVSTAKGVYNCFSNAEEIGAECLQIFGASPRQWRAKLPDNETLKLYYKEKERSKLGQIFLHAAYLVNLGTSDEELYRKSIENLTLHLQIAELLEAEGLIYHIGSYKNTTLEKSITRVVEGMHEVLKNSPGKANLIMENSAGGGNKIGTNVKEIGEIFRKASHPRIKVCIDTCHAFAAGELKDFTKEEIENYAEKCDTAFGLQNLTVLHVNDSKASYGSNTDRHENIGKGQIGLDAFKNLRAHNNFGSIPWILEVPGYEGNGPDAPNIDTVKSL